MPGLKARATPASALTARWQAAIDDHVVALRWSSDGRWLAAAAASGPIAVLDAQSGRQGSLLSGHAMGTLALAWQPGTPMLASAGQDGKVRLWDVAAGVARLSLAGGAAWVERLNWRHDGVLLASAAGRTLRLWTPGGALAQETADHASTIADLGWRPGGDDLAVVAYGGLTRWRPDPAATAGSPELVRRYAWKGSSLVLAWSPDGRYIATGDQDDTVHFWLVQSGKDLQMWGYQNKVRELAWHHSSRYLATGGSPVVTIWDTGGKGPEGTRPLQLEGHRASISALAYQRGGPLLASGGQDGRVSLWHPTGNRRLLGHVNLGDEVAQLAWSPDDRLLAAGAASGALVVLEAPRI